MPRNEKPSDPNLQRLPTDPERTRPVPTPLPTTASQPPVRTGLGTAPTANQVGELQANGFVLRRAYTAGSNPGERGSTEAWDMPGHEGWLTRLRFDDDDGHARIWRQAPGAIGVDAPHTEALRVNTLAAAFAFAGKP